MMLVLRRVGLLAVLLLVRWWMAQAVPPHAGPEWVTYARTILGALITISLALLIDGVIRTFFWKGYLTNVMGAKVPRLLPLTVSILIFGSAIFHILQNQLGLSLGGALAASGFIAVILGFALRSVILDLFSGLAISIDRSYSVGDWISVTSRDLEDEVYGNVIEIDWRTTRMRLEDGRTFIMPNSIGGVFTITNHSQPPGPKRLHFTMHLPHETPVPRARKLLAGAVMKALSGPGLSREPAPSILVSDVTTDGVDYLIRFYADIHEISPTVARAQVREAVLEALSGNDLRIPPAQIELVSPRDRELHARHAITPEAAIRQTRLFGTILTTEEIADLAAHSRQRHLAPEEALIREGEDGASLFILLSGAAAVFRQNGHATAHELATLSTGDIAGEMSLLTGEKRSASVIATTDLEALEIGRDALAPIMKRRPDIAGELSQLLTYRSGAMDDHDQARITGPDGPVAVAKSLVERIRAFFSL